MLKVEKYNKISELEKIWTDMQKNNQNIDAMADFEFVKMFTSGITNKIKSLLKKSSAVYYVVFNEKKPVLIFSANVKNDIIESLYTLDFYDLVTYEKSSGKEIYEALLEISKLEKKPIVLNKLKTSKNTYNKLSELVEFEDDVACVKIDYTADYEAYYQSLTKHARQNLRTAYNRLKTDELTYKFEFVMGQTDKKLASKLKNLYLNRRAKKYSNMNILKKMVYKIDEPISKVCFGLKNSFSAVLYVGDKIACYMAGIIKNGEAIVPRLAIDDRFSRYSVGVILVNETIKELIKKSIFTLDLAIGTETYKTQMGGVEYKIKKCKIDANENL